MSPAVRDKDTVYGQLEEIVRLLASEFGVPMPGIRVSNSSRACYAYPTRHTHETFGHTILGRSPYGKITIGIRRQNQDLVDSVLHEFAHHLVVCRSPNLKAAQRIHHKKMFYSCLVDVATAWYGDPAKYEWQYDYARVRQWAAKDGHGPVIFATPRTFTWNPQTQSYEDSWGLCS